jgi:hypothetical protein
MKETIDWEQVAIQAGAIQDRDSPGQSERGGSEIARKSIEIIIGKDAIRDAVDYYLENGSGGSVIRSVLWLIRPESAMQRCYEIYRSDAPIEIRRNAVHLLKTIGDESILPWVSEFLDDPDEGINLWGANTLDELLLSGFVSPTSEFQELLNKAENHPNQNIQEQIRRLLVRERYEKYFD